MSKDEIKFPNLSIAPSLDPYYKNIASIMLGVTGEDIKLSEEDVYRRKERLLQLDEIIKKPDVWSELVEKYKTPGNKINYNNVHNSLLQHYHVHPIRHIGRIMILKISNLFITTRKNLLEKFQVVKMILCLDYHQELQWKELSILVTHIKDSWIKKSYQLKNFFNLVNLSTQTERCLIFLVGN